MKGLETSCLLEVLADDLAYQLDLETTVSDGELEGELPLEILYSANGVERWQSRLFNVLEAFQDDYDVHLSIDFQQDLFIIQLI